MAQLAPINQASPLALMLLQVSEDLAHLVLHHSEEDPPHLTLLRAHPSVVLLTALLVHPSHSDLLSQEALVDLVLLARLKDLLHHSDLVSQEAPLDLLLLKDPQAQEVQELLASHSDLPDPKLPDLLKDLHSHKVQVPQEVFKALELLSPQEVLVVLKRPLSLVPLADHRLLQVYLHPVVQVVHHSQALLLLLVHQALLPLLLTLKHQHSLVPLRDLLLLVHLMDLLAQLDLKILQDQDNQCLLVHQVLLLAHQDHLNLTDLPSPLDLNLQLSLRVLADLHILRVLKVLLNLFLHKLLVALRALNSLQDQTNLVHLKDLVLQEALQDLDTLVAQLDLRLLNRQVSLKVLADLHILRVLKVLLNLRVLANLVHHKDPVLQEALKVPKALASLVLLKVL